MKRRILVSGTLAIVATLAATAPAAQGATVVSNNPLYIAENYDDCEQPTLFGRPATIWQGSAAIVYHDQSVYLAIRRARPLSRIPFRVYATRTAFPGECSLEFTGTVQTNLFGNGTALLGAGGDCEDAFDVWISAQWAGLWAKTRGLDLYNPPGTCPLP